MQEIVKEIRDVLSEVKYPGTSKSIVSLDIDQNIKSGFPLGIPKVQ